MSFRLHIKYLLVAIFVAIGLVNATAQTAAVPNDTLSKVVKLEEIIVKPGKEKYSKKNNPAVDFMERIRAAQELTNPRAKDHYSFDKYERIVLALNNVTDSTGELRGMMKHFPILKQHIDTSRVTGHTILPFSVTEKASENFYRKEPRRTREYVTGMRQSSVVDIPNMDGVQTFTEEILRDIDLYQNDITLLSNRFVSPLSKIGADFYKYYLSDTVVVATDTCVVLSFAPRNNATFGFVGRLYVPQNDSTMFIKKVDMTLSHNANVNFIKSLRLTQEFDRDSTGVRLQTLDDLSIEFMVLPGAPEIYAHKYTKYSNHSFDSPTRPELFDRLGEVYMAADAYLKDDIFWAGQRDETYHPSHGKLGNLAAFLHSVPLFYWIEKGVKILVRGYIPIDKADKFEYGPVNTTLSFNDVEGVRLRAGGVTTANLNKHWFFRGYGAYGTKDHKWKYYGEVEYSFNEKKRHSREFPIRSIRVSYKDDVDAIGQNYAFTNPDNIFISFKRMSDTLMVYKRDACVKYTWELDNHLSWSVALNRSREIASRYVNFNWANGQHTDHLDFSTAEITLRFAPGEKFLQTKSNRVPINLDNPTIQISHTFGPARFLGSSRYVINKTEMDLRKRFWFSAFGYLDAIMKSGHVWSTVPFTQLLIPNANLTFTIQDETFALLNPMEFVTDTYAALDITYWANGALLNYIPGLKKLRLREALSVRTFWGRLSNKNNPEYNPALPQFPEGANPVLIKNTPYVEMGIGIDNIFSILRIDYSWRLTYRHTPGVDRHGLRMALHFTF